jgi:sugar lactone lactonase YvrE
VTASQLVEIDWAARDLEVVHEFTGPMPTGVTVSAEGRVFVNFPLWGDDVTATVAEVRDGSVVPYPDKRWNSPSGMDDAAAFVSVQSVVVDPRDRLWALDTGSPEFKPTQPGGPKLVCIDLTTDTVERVITVPPNVALPTTYLNDIRFDLRRGPGGTAYITDSSDQGPNGIIVVDLASGESWRRLHDHPSTKAVLPPSLRMLVEGRDFVERDENGQTAPISLGSDGIALGHDGARLYYCPLASRRLYSVATDALVDRAVSDEEVAATVQDEGDKGSAGDGMEADDAGGIYVTDGEHNAIHRRDPDGSWRTVAHDPALLWPDTMSLAADGYLYVTANQLQRQARYRGGVDERVYPYLLLRTRVENGPVRLA